MGGDDILHMINILVSCVSRALDHKFGVSSKAKSVAAKFKQAAQKFDSKLSVSQPAKEIARKTDGAESVAGAAKTAEKVCLLLRRGKLRPPR